MISINLKACKQKNLEPGQTCMSVAELEEYYNNLTVRLQFLHNYIEYDDIENPIKTIYS